METTKKVLLVEDDLDLRKSLADRLSQAYQIEEAGDGEEAVTKVLDFAPNLIVLDLLLPKLDGFQLLERLRTYPDPNIVKIPVVIFSNMRSDDDISKAKTLQVSEYFIKSNTQIEDVVEKVKKMMSE